MYEYCTVQESKKNVPFYLVWLSGAVAFTMLIFLWLCFTHSIIRLGWLIQNQNLKSFSSPGQSAVE